MYVTRYCKSYCESLDNKQNQRNRKFLLFLSFSYFCFNVFGIWKLNMEKEYQILFGEFSCQDSWETFDNTIFSELILGKERMTAIFWRRNNKMKTLLKYLKGKTNLVDTINFFLFYLFLNFGRSGEELKMFVDCFQ